MESACSTPSNQTSWENNIPNYKTPILGDSSRFTDSEISSNLHPIPPSVSLSNIWQPFWVSLRQSSGRVCRRRSIKYSAITGYIWSVFWCSDAEIPDARGAVPTVPWNAQIRSDHVNNLNTKWDPPADRKSCPLPPLLVSGNRLFIVQVGQDCGLHQTAFTTDNKVPHTCSNVSRYMAIFVIHFSCNLEFYFILGDVYRNSILETSPDMVWFIGLVIHLCEGTERGV